MTGGKTTVLVGWVLSGLLALLLSVSAVFKLSEWDGKADEFAKIGFTTEIMFGIGVVEVAITLVYLFPPTGFLGAILLTGYLGGATVTHARVNEPVFGPVIIGVVVWIALGLRRPEIFSLALGKRLT